MDENKSQKGRTFVYSEAEHRKAKRNQKRLLDIKPLVEKIRKVTSQIK